MIWHNRRVSEHEASRLVAWSQELRRVHSRLRDALQLTQAAVVDAPGGGGLDAASALDQHATRELLLYCHGFCAALDGHHRGEDRALFPAIAAANPELGPVLRKLEQDHSMIAHLLTGLRDASDRTAPPEELALHLEGIAAIMESHFRYEERQLLTVLDILRLEAAPRDVLGPL
jgi:hemerythrin-like domain-containing protein